MKILDMISGSAFILLGIYLISEGSKLKVGSFASPKPGFVPVILGFLLIFLSVILVGKSLLSKKFEKDNSFLKANLFKIIPIFMSIIAYGLFIELAGFLITTFLWFSLVMLILKPKSPIKAFFYGAIASSASYILFNILLQGQFPKGFFGI